MHQDKRVFRTCIFCGARAASKEHIFGDALRKALNLNSHWTAPQVEGDPVQHWKKGASPLTHIQAKCLCKDCNEVRFGQTFMRRTSQLVQMAYAEEVPNFLQCKDDIRQYFESRAFILDVLTSNHELHASSKAVQENTERTMNGRHPPLFNDAVRRKWLSDRRSASDVRIYLGQHGGVFGLMPFMAERGVLSMRPVKPSKRFIIVLRTLAICLEIGEALFEPPPKSFTRLSELGSWPPKNVPLVEYDHIYSLQQQSREVIEKRNNLRDRDFISFHEAIYFVEHALDNGWNHPNAREWLANIHAQLLGSKATNKKRHIRRGDARHAST
jgi:hypothetical protein